MPANPAILGSLIGNTRPGNLMELLDLMEQSRQLPIAQAFTQRPAGLRGGNVRTSSRNAPGGIYAAPRAR